MKTASGATAVQIEWSSRRGSRQIEHIGSAHDYAELEALKAAARQRLVAGQLELDEGGQGEGFREPGFSKERRLEPQITIGLLTGQDGVPADGLCVRETGPRARPCSR